MALECLVAFMLDLDASSRCVSSAKNSSHSRCAAEYGVDGSDMFEAGAG